MSSEEAIDDIPDPRGYRDRQYDAVVDLVRQSAEQVSVLSDMVKAAIERQGNTQRIVYKAEGAGGLIGAAIAVGFCAMLALIAAMIWIVPEIHDLNAWRVVHNNDISALKADVKQMKEKTK